MANRAQAVPENVPDEFFVDTTCIDCDTCRQLAPQVFRAVGAYVQAQPRDVNAHRHALRRDTRVMVGSS